jgi:hypothetical protein
VPRQRQPGALWAPPLARRKKSMWGGCASPTPLLQKDFATTMVSLFVLDKAMQYMIPYKLLLNPSRNAEVFLTSFG